MSNRWFNAGAPASYQGDGTRSRSALAHCELGDKVMQRTEVPNPIEGHAIQSALRLGRHIALGDSTDPHSPHLGNKLIGRGFDTQAFPAKYP